MRHVAACLCLALASVSIGCVQSYQAIDYPSTDFVRASSDDGLEFAYLYDAHPGYYGSKAAKRGYSVVAVRIVNTTSEPVALDRNTLQVFYGDEPVHPVRGEVATREVRQPVLNKLLWALLNVTVYDGNGEVSAFIPAGPVIAIVTMLASASNNRKARRDYTEQSVFALTVAPGQTAEGLMILQGTGRAPLSFDYAPVGG